VNKKKQKNFVNLARAGFTSAGYFIVSTPPDTAQKITRAGITSTG
jgi:hypothetical protein